MKPLEQRITIQAMRYHIMVWTVCGLWDIPGNPMWYRIYKAFLTVIFYVMYPLFIAIQLLFTANFNEMIDILLILPTACAGIKGSFVIIKRKQIKALLQLLDDMDQLIDSDDHRRILNEQLSGSMLLVKILSCIYYSTVVSSFLVAFLAEERRFIWQSYYPFDYQHNLGHYYFFLFFQFGASFLVSFIFSSLDLYGSALYKMLGGHIDILGDKVKQLGTVKSLAKLIAEQGAVELNDAMMSQQFAADLKHCVVYHNYCIRYNIRVLSLKITHN